MAKERKSLPKVCKQSPAHRRVETSLCGGLTVSRNMGALSAWAGGILAGDSPMTLWCV